MATLTEEVRLYWVPGCGICTRLKGYLADRGIAFNAINVQSDPAAFDDMKRAGIQSVPVVRVGERWATGMDLRQVDELLGLTKDPASRVLPIEELTERAAGFLDAACRFARQLPADHYNDPTPTMEKFERAMWIMRDGTEYIPHRSSKLLVHHIAGHGEKFWRFALSADGRYELGYAIDSSGDQAAFGEPDDATPMYRVIDQMELTASDIRSWGRLNSQCDLSGMVQTHYGPQTSHQLLQSNLCSMAQHSRQLTDIIDRLGIAPEGPIESQMLEGLLIPTGVWS
jgi:glutaredoxin 3